MPSTVTCRVEGGVAQVRLNRPDKLNALTLDTLEDLVTTARDLSRDRTLRGVVERLIFAEPLARDFRRAPCTRDGHHAYLGGLVIAAGWGYTAPSWVGVGLAVLGLGILAVSVLVHRRDHPDRATLRPVGPLGTSPDAEIVAKVT